MALTLSDLSDSANELVGSAGDLVDSIELPDMSGVGDLVVEVGSTVAPIAGATVEVVGDAAVAAGRGGRRVVTIVREHPRPVAGIAVGIAVVGIGAYLWARSRNDDATQLQLADAA